MARQYDKDKLIAKVKAKKPLTRSEERYYMLKILNIPKRMVDNIFAINDNKNPNLIID